jgi:hypothetical protein
MKFTEVQFAKIKKRNKELIDSGKVSSLFQLELLNKQNEIIGRIASSAKLTDKEYEELLIIQLNNALNNMMLLDSLFITEELGFNLKPQIRKITDLIEDFEKGD